MPVLTDIHPYRDDSGFERLPPTVEDGAEWLVGVPGQWRVSPAVPLASMLRAREARLMRKVLDGDGNLLTLAVNKLGRVLGFNPQAVSYEDQLVNARLLESQVDVPFSPLQRDIRPVIRDRVDAAFDPKVALTQWAKDSPMLMSILERHGYDVEAATRDSTNEQWFRYQLNYMLAKIQAEQRIEERNRHVGVLRWMGEAGFDSIVHYIVLDPTSIPGLVVTGGSTGLARGAASLADDITNLGVRLGRARGAAQAGLVTRAAASSVKYVGSAPALLHAGLAARIGHAAALGAELASVGAVLGAGVESEMMRNWNLVFGGTDQEMTWNWNHVLLSTGLMGAIGVVTGGLAGGWRPSSWKYVREGAVTSATGVPGTRGAKRGWTAETTVLMQAEDQARVHLAEKLERVAPSTSADAADLQWLLNPEFTERHGMEPFQVEALVDEISGVVGNDNMPKSKLIGFLLDYLTAAEAWAKKHRFQPPTTGPAAIRYRTLRADVEERLVREGLDPRTKSFARRVLSEAADAIRRDPIPPPVTEFGELSRERIAHLQQEMLDLIQLQKTRGLALREEERMLELESVLNLQDAIPPAARRDISKLSATPDSEFHPGVFRPETKVGRDFLGAMALRHRLADARAAGDAKTVAQLLPRAERRMLDLLTPPEPGEEGPTLAEIMVEEASKPAETRSARIEAVVRRKSAIDAGSHLLMQDIHATAVVMRGWGLGDWVSSVALHKTGLPSTVRSAFAAVREAAAFVDLNHFRVDHMSPSGPIHTGTLMEARLAMERKLAPMNAFMQRLFEQKKIKTSAQRDAFYHKVILAIHDLLPAEDADVEKMANMWLDAALDLFKEGVANGKLPKDATLEEFGFPIRVRVGRLRKRTLVFHNVLSEHMTRRWLESETVNPEVLVRMGMASRSVSPAGTVKFAPTSSIVDELPTKRSQLTPEMERDYVAALTGTNQKFLDDRGETAVQFEMWQVVNGMLDQKTFDQGKDGIIRFYVPTPEEPEFKRLLSKDLLIDPDVEDIFDWNFMDMAYDYLRTTGFEIRATSFVQRMTSVPGLRVGEYFDAMQVVAERIAKRGSQEVKDISIGMNQLRAKWDMMRGATPRYVSEAEGIGETVAEAAVSGTTAVYGFGIGPLVAFGEAMKETFARVYSLQDFFDNIGQAFRFISSLKNRREALEDMAVGLRLNRHNAAERFTSGVQGSNFHYNLRSKLVDPWMDAWGAATGEFLPGGRVRSRTANAAIQGIKAVGTTMLTLGGTDFWTNYARSMAVHTLQRETARYLPAAARMAERLEVEFPNMLKVNARVRAAALSRGQSLEDAIRLGNKEQFKLWRKLARESGFGPNWQVALRFAQARLMNSKKLNLFIATARSTGSLTKRALDLTEVARSLSGLNKQDRFMVQEAIEQIHNSIEDVLRKRISEQGPLQTPTDPGSLVYHGRIMNAMFSFARSFVDNNVIDQAYLPQHVGLFNLAGFIFGEVTGQVARRLLRGESLDDIEQEWRDNPERTLVRYLMSVPLVGQATPFVQAYAEAALGGSGRSVEVGRSAATGVMGEMVNLTANFIAAPADIAKGNRLTRLSSGADKLASRMVPGYGLFKHSMDLDSIDRVPDGVRSSHQKLRDTMKAMRWTEARGGDLNIKDPDEAFTIEDILDDLSPQQDIIEEQDSAGVR